MDRKPKLIVIHGISGEQREYDAENEQDLDESFDCIDGHFKWLARARQNLNKARHEEHVRLMQAKTIDYLKTEGFQGSYSAVFLLMLGSAKYGGRIPLDHRQIEERLKYSRQTVSRALTHLVTNGMVVIGEHEGREAYFLTKPAAQKGRVAPEGTKQMATDIRDRISKLPSPIKVIQGGKAS